MGHQGGAEPGRATTRVAMLVKGSRSFASSLARLLPSRMKKLSSVQNQIGMDTSSHNANGEAMILSEEDLVGICMVAAFIMGRETKT